VIAEDYLEDRLLELEAEPRARLAAYGALPDDRFPMVSAALDLAEARNPGLNQGPYKRHLERLAADVGAYAGGEPVSLETKREALVQVIARRYGYGGDESVFDDLDAADLSRVIDTRRGLPVALGIIYMDVCRRLGWSIVGIDFPGRFLVRLEDRDERMILDLYEDGRVMNPPELRVMLKSMAGAKAELQPHYLAEMSARRVVLRLEDNIRARQVQRDQLTAAAETLDLMLMFAPATGYLWREAGIVNARLDRIGIAIKQLEEYLKHSPGEESGYETSLLLQDLRAKLN